MSPTNAEITAAAVLLKAIDATPEGIADRRFLARALEDASVTEPAALAGGVTLLEQVGFFEVGPSYQSRDRSEPVAWRYRLTRRGADFIDAGMRWDSL